MTAAHEDADLRDTSTARAFILELGRGLHEAGAPSHRIEDAMSMLSSRLGVTGQFFTTPTSIFASFGPPEEQRTALLRVEPSGVNLERMSLLDDLIREVEGGRREPEDAIVWLRAIAAAPERHGRLLPIACFGIAAAAAIGLQTGVLARLASRPDAARVFEWVAALAAALAALGWALIIGPLVPTIAALSGLIVLVPGLSLAVAFTEISTRNLVSGTARLAGAAMTFLAIGFGLALGTRLQPLVGAAALVVPAAPLPAWTEWLARDVVSEMELAFTLVVLATALAAGLLLANLVVPPRRAV